MLLLPSVALADTTISFDDLSAGTVVSNQYASQGVSFGPIPQNPLNPMPKPTVTSAAGQAHSGVNVATINCPSCNENLGDIPDASGTFTVQRSHVYAYVGLLGTKAATCASGSTAPTCAVVTLTGYDAGGHAVATSSPVTVTQGLGVNTLISISTATPTIVAFEFSTRDPTDSNKVVAIDDLGFDVPESATPDFTLHPASGDVRLVQGSTATDSIAISRISGSTGDISFSAGNLPPGVTASFAPDPANGAQTILTLSADPSAPPIYGGDVPITITASPLSATAGPTARTATVDVGVTPAFTVRVQANTNVDLSACTVQLPLTVARDPSFAGEVSLSITGLPPGVTSSFTPPKATFPGSTVSTTVLLTLTVPQTGFTSLRRTATIHATDPPFGEEDATISVGGTCALKFDPEVISMQVTQGTQLPVLPKRDPANPAAPIIWSSIGGQAAANSQQALAELAAFKPTVVRVYADLKYGPAAGVQVPAVLNGFTFDARGNKVVLPGSPILPVATPGNLLLNLSAFGDDFLQNNYSGVYTFALPSSWERGKIELQAQLLPTQPSALPPVAKAAAFPGQAPIWAPCTTSSCQTDNRLTITGIPFLYTFPVTIRPVAMIVTHPYDATLPDPLTVFQWAGLVSPMPLIIEPYAGSLDIADQIGNDNSKGAVTVALLNKLNDYVCNEGQPDHGWVVGVEHADIRSAQANAYCTLFGSGLAFDATPVQFALVNSPEPLVSVAHEMYHLYGRPHASAGCGANVGLNGSGTQPAENWPPDQQGFLQSIGLAPAQPGSSVPYQLIPDTAVTTGTQWFDFMSYCDVVSDGSPLTGGRNGWISVHNWNAVLGSFGYSAAGDRRPASRAAVRTASVPTTPSLEVRASVAPGGQVTIDDIEPVNAPTPPPATSPYELIGTDANGTTMTALPMRVSFGHIDSNPPQPILTLTGVVPATGVTGIKITSAGSTLALRTESPTKPSITIPRLPSFRRSFATLHWQATGAAVTVRVDYSGDGGRRWHPIWIGANLGSTVVPSRYLYRSANARIRVTVNDGFRAASAISRRFRAPGAPPTVEIVMPWQHTRQLVDAPLGLSGEAFDDSSRMLAGGRLRWLLGRRLLGTGPRITVTGLTRGRHVIDLVATDGFGRRGSASVTVVMRAARPVFIVLSTPHRVSRGARSLRVIVGSSQPATLTVRTRGERTQRFAVGRSKQRLRIRIRRGQSTLGLKLSLSAGGLTRDVQLAISR